MMLRMIVSDCDALQAVEMQVRLRFGELGGLTVSNTATISAAACARLLHGRMTRVAATTNKAGHCALLPYCDSTAAVRLLTFAGLTAADIRNWRASTVRNGATRNTSELARSKCGLERLADVPFDTSRQGSVRPQRRGDETGMRASRRAWIEFLPWLQSVAMHFSS